MKYFIWFFKGQRTQSWVLRYIDSAEEQVKLRPEYHALRCEGCGKVDERIALKQGIARTISIKSKFDFVQTSDDVLCFSERMRGVLMENGVDGIDYIDIPGDKNYFIAFPAILVATDIQKANYSISKICTKCGRAIERAGLPPSTSLLVPVNPKSLFEPDIQSESHYGRRDLLYSSEVVVAILKKNKITGIEYTCI
jgi:hypothetical protein